MLVLYTYKEMLFVLLGDMCAYEWILRYIWLRFIQLF